MKAAVTAVLLAVGLSTAGTMERSVDGDGRCPGFFSLRTNEEVIWRDTRGAS